MEKRTLRPRKFAAKENIQPAKRTRRAFSTIERIVHTESPQMKRTKSPQTVQVKNVSFVQNIQTQTECCLEATNAKLVEQLIAKNNLLQLKDQKYIQMLQRFYLVKEQLTAEIQQKTVEINGLNERIRLMENEPLIDVEPNGKYQLIINIY